VNLLLLQSLLDAYNIEVLEIVENNKASEVYVRTIFTQDDGFVWETYVPFVDRRSAREIKTEQELAAYLVSIKPYFAEDSMEAWRRTELKRGLIRGSVTPSFFEVLLSFREEFEKLPSNPNSARRIQDIKDAGYTVASVPRKKGSKGYSRIMLPLPLNAEMSYETFTPQFKARVVRLLGGVNAYEARPTTAKALILDHKFSEVRWDEATKAENSPNMTDDEIRAKFQLLDNQRNQQKREICRKCFQDNVRGQIFGIDYFYKGGKEWDGTIPKVGKGAEQGCDGCPWYDIQKWRKLLNEELENNGD